MKIDRYAKQSIATAILQDIPKPAHSVVRDAIQAALVKAMSPEARKLYKTAPKALATRRLASYESLLDFGVDFVVGDADYETVFAPYKAQARARDDVARQVQAAINSCNTLKQLKDRLPEFGKYFPTEAPTSKNLPAIANMVADLSKLGWPKDKTQTAVK